jgi:hypothetical protein
MLAEMDSMPFVQRTWNELPGPKTGNAGGGAYDLVGGTAGAPVYNDILAASPGVSDMTRGQVVKGIRNTLETGNVNNAFSGALATARARLTGGGGVSAATLPPDAGNVAHLLGKLEDVPLPVDVTGVKSTMQPVYDRLYRESQLVPLQGDKARALTAIDRLMNGPDHVPLSVANGVLSDIGSMAGKVDELRSPGQGVMAKEWQALNTAVQQTAQRAGPQAVQALQQGRAATTAKYTTADVLDTLHAEPGKLFDQLTARKDGGIERLRNVATIAPDEMPNVGRAVLEGLLTKATEKGGFQRAAALSAAWDNLGEQTKAILFKGQVPDLSNFFLLAKKAAENPNPSGSGYIVSLVAQGAHLAANPVTGIPTQLGAAALSKALRSPAVVRALTKGFTVPIGSGAATTAGLNIVKALGDAGIPVATAAGGPADRPQATAPPWSAP